MTDQHDPAEPSREKAFMFATTLATNNVLRALIKTHPDPVALVEQINLEHEETMALLLNNPVYDIGIEMFEEAIQLLGAEIVRTQQPPSSET